MTRRTSGELNLTGRPRVYGGLVEYILIHVRAARTPLRTQEIRERLLDDYGSINERMLYNYLRVMRTKGMIKATLSPERLGFYPTYLYSPPEPSEACQSAALGSVVDDSP